MAIVTYRDFNLNLQCRAEDGHVWTTLAQLAELYGVTRRNVEQHVQNILREGELPNAVAKDFFATASDGKNYRTRHVNEEMVLRVGMRINSDRGRYFRDWATAVLLGRVPGPVESSFFSRMTCFLDTLADRGFGRMESLLTLFVGRAADAVMERMPVLLDQYFQSAQGTLSEEEVKALFEKIHLASRIEGKNIRRYHWELKRRFGYGIVELVNPAQRRLLERHLDEVIEAHPPVRVVLRAPAPETTATPPETAPPMNGRSQRIWLSLRDWHCGVLGKTGVRTGGVDGTMALADIAIQESHKMGYPPRKRPSKRYGSINLYHRDVLQALWPSNSGLTPG